MNWKDTYARNIKKSIYSLRDDVLFGWIGNKDALEGAAWSVVVWRGKPTNLNQPVRHETALLRIAR